MTPYLHLYILHWLVSKKSKSR